MLSERISSLFHMLQCTNSDIARFAGCSPSHISRLKSGLREPKPDSRTVLRLAQGVCRYADHENMLKPLCELCGTVDERPEALIPAVITWLYEDRAFHMPEMTVPKRKREEASRLQFFGERLDRIMALLEYTNVRLAADLNVDASLVSRYRAGIHHPNRNVRIREHLAELLLTRAEKTGRLRELADLCEVKEEALTPEALAEWLYDPKENLFSEIANSILLSIDVFEPGSGMPSSPPQIPPVTECGRYWGTEGLRGAVVRFLTEAAHEGGELLLYSDEPMDWLSSDASYFAVWASLMAACLRSGVHIRIIHNMDRDGREMVSAINGWLPLYISDLIEPYVFTKNRNTRFYHTVFLRPDGAAIHGFFPSESGENRWYDYITDKEQLRALQLGYDAMLACAEPFLKTYPVSWADNFWNQYRSSTGKTAAILRGISVASMPEALLRGMLSRAGIQGEQSEKAISFYHTARDHMERILRSGDLYELFCLPDPRDVKSGSVKVNFEAETNGICLYYTAEEYAAHIAAVKELIRGEKHYHAVLLPHIPFQDLQIFTMKNAAAVIRCRQPYKVFAFYNSLLVQSVSCYCDSLAAQYAAGRYEVIQALESVVRG